MHTYPIRFAEKLFVVLLIIFVVFFISTSIGLFEAPDSVHYAILGQYLTNGTILPVYPFNTMRPSLLFGPMYSIIMLPLLSLPWPWGITLIPAIQFFLIVVQATLLIRIYRHLLPNPIATMTILVFIFYPFQLVYATYLLSETLTQFLLTLYLYTLFRLNQTKWATPDMLIFLAAVLTLTRYVFIVLFVYSIGRYLFAPKRIVGALGVAIVLAWMLFNLKTHGVFQLTSHTGRHVYNNVVTLGKLLPAPENPQTKFFFSRISGEQVFRPWWENQVFFSDLDEPRVDRMFRSVAFWAIREHPVRWIKTIAYAFFHTPTSSPYQDTPYRSFQIHTLLSGCAPVPRMSWNTNISIPPLQNCFVSRVWNWFLDFQRKFYPNIASAIFAISLVGIIVSLKAGGISRQFAVLFLLIHLTQSATEWIEGRFLVPLYPLYVFFVSLGITSLYRLKKIP